MRSLFTLLKVLALFLTLSPGLSLADDFPKPNTDYSADYLVHDLVKDLKGKIFYSNGNERLETIYDNKKYVLIIQPGRLYYHVLNPRQKIYDDIFPTTANRIFGYIPALTEVKYEKVGKEVINGEKTIKRKYPVGCKECRFEGFTWHTSDGIMVKIMRNAISAPRFSKVSMEIMNIKRGKQDPALFEVPDNYELPDDDLDMNDYDLDIMDGG